jgi:phosphatidylglycerol---prolipoprotein diacylglyceryl transferase
MRPVLFEVPGIGWKVHSFGVMLVIAVFAALRLADWRARRVKIDPVSLQDLALWLIVGGVVGARVFYVVQHHETIHSFLDLFKFWQGGIVLYGSLLGGLLGGVLYWLRRPFPFLATADVVAPTLALAIALGRIGCFLNGCCYGDPCELPWAVSFPSGSPPWVEEVETGLISPTSAYSLPLHPTQIYSLIDGLIILALLMAYYPLRRRDGEVMALLMVTYPITRFLIEQLRGDEGIFFAGMTVSQNLSLLIFGSGVLFWAWLSRRPAGRYADEVEQANRADEASAIGLPVRNTR